MPEVPQQRVSQVHRHIIVLEHTPIDQLKLFALDRLAARDDLLNTTGEALRLPEEALDLLSRRMAIGALHRLGSREAE